MSAQRQYSNPRLAHFVTDWPYGKRRTTAYFLIISHPTRGERAERYTIDPKTGKGSKPKTLTYARQVRIVDGDDGKTYLLERTMHSGSLSVMQGDMKFQAETVYDTDERYAALLALFEVSNVPA